MAPQGQTGAYDGQMDRERELAPGVEPERGSGEIAGRLDRLNAEQAEDVMRRAIELTDEEDDVYEYGQMDSETLEQVAGELGIPARHVRKAMAEQRASRHSLDEETSWFERLFGIVDLDEAVIIEGQAVDIERAVETWMKTHEGLRLKRRTRHGAIWAKDDRPLAAIRMGLGITHGTKSLRSTGDIEHTLRSVNENEHLLSIAASKNRLRLAAILSLVGAGILSVSTVIAAAFGPLGDLRIPGLAGSLVFAAGLTTIAVAGVRSWASKIRTAVERAVDAVVAPDRSGLYDTFPGRLGNMLKSWGLFSNRHDRRH